MFDAKAMGARLQYLRELHGLTLDEAGKKIEINVATLRALEQTCYRAEIHFATLVKLATFYNVSTDYILGLAELPEEHYKAELSELYEKAYEKYVKIQRDKGYEIQPEGTQKIIIAPYPYNLLEKVFPYDFNKIPVPLNAEQKTALNLILDRLKARERDCLHQYYFGHKTLEEIAEFFGVTRERVRQIIAKAIRKLRHKSFLGEIIRWAYPEEYQELLKKREEYEEICREVNALSLEIASKKDILETIKDKKELETLREVVSKASGDPLNTSLLDLELSVRSFNALARHFERPWMKITANDICKLFNENKIENRGDRTVVMPLIYKVRNLGSKSVSEIASALIRVGCDVAYPDLSKFVKTQEVG